MTTDAPREYEGVDQHSVTDGIPVVSPSALVAELCRLRMSRSTDMTSTALRAAPR
jgi:hypothetical protein